jgi:hypothetical protein
MVSQVQPPYGILYPLYMYTKPRALRRETPVGASKNQHVTLLSGGSCPAASPTKSRDLTPTALPNLHPYPLTPTAYHHHHHHHHHPARPAPRWPSPRGLACPQGSRSSSSPPPARPWRSSRRCTPPGSSCPTARSTPELKHQGSRGFKTCLNNDGLQGLQTCVERCFTGSRDTFHPSDNPQRA